MPHASSLPDLLMIVLPGGGQRTARRNAWAGMAADVARARARREAEDALAVAGSAAQHRVSTGS